MRNVLNRKKNHILNFFDFFFELWSFLYSKYGQFSMNFRCQGLSALEVSTPVFLPGFFPPGSFPSQGFSPLGGHFPPDVVPNCSSLRSRQNWGLQLEQVRVNGIFRIGGKISREKKPEEKKPGEKKLGGTQGWKLLGGEVPVTEFSR